MFTSKALSIPGYIVGYCMFNYAVPEPDRDLMHADLELPGNRSPSREGISRDVRLSALPGPLDFHLTGRFFYIIQPPFSSDFTSFTVLCFCRKM